MLKNLFLISNRLFPFEQTAYVPLVRKHFFEVLSRIFIKIKFEFKGLNSQVIRRMGLFCFKIYFIFKYVCMCETACLCKC